MKINFDKDLCPDRVTLEDLIIAYRKAKVDTYYTPNSNLLKIAEYEENLNKNLENLLDNINSNNTSWLHDDNFLGDWSVKTKGIIFSDNEKKTTNGNILFSDPNLSWDKMNVKKDSTATFRLIAKPSMNFQVLSALWIMKVGVTLDSRLSENSYGSRIRVNKDKSFNKYSIGSFIPYMENYQNWRNRASECMKDALEKKKSIVAITSDVSGFYHNVNPSFLKGDDFYDSLNIKLSYTGKMLTNYLVDAINAWTKKGPTNNGIPIDLPASAVIANLALYHLDKIIENEVCPLYYGRYVDDIIIVLDNPNKFKSQDEVLKWLTSKADNKTDDTDSINIELTYLDKKDLEKQLHFTTSYLNDSNIVFKNKKNKVFFLDSKTGRHLVSSIISQMRIESSEWRMLPELPDEIEDIESMVISAVSETGNITSNLRNTDTISLRRSSFALTLRSFETYARDLKPDRWVEKREEFYKSCLNFMLVLPGFFELSVYLPRVISLATSCEDYEYLVKIIKSLDTIVKTVGILENIKLSCQTDNTENLKDEILIRWKKELEHQIRTTITSSYNSGGST